MTEYIGASWVIPTAAVYTANRFCGDCPMVLDAIQSTVTTGPCNHGHKFCSTITHYMIFYLFENTVGGSILWFIVDLNCPIWKKFGAVKEL